MILTDIIEFYKCLKSLSGATAPLNEWKKKRKRGSGGWWWGRNNHSAKYSGWRKMFEKLLWESIRCAGTEASCHLGSASFSSPTSLTEKEQKEKNSREVRRWGRGPSLPSELRSHLEKTSASLINLSSPSPGGWPLAPHTHNLILHFGTTYLEKCPLHWITPMCLQTDLPFHYLLLILSVTA